MKSSLIRPCIQKLHAYVPGEQPKVKGLIKLNTNENPYPPSPKVIKAIKSELDQRLRLYPNPNSDGLRTKIAEVYGFKLNQVIAGNGSDDILTLCLRAFVDERKKVQFPKPTYSLYPVLTQIQNGRIKEVPYDSKYQLRVEDFDPKAALTFIVNPNAPTGTSVSQSFLKALAKRLKGVLVIDEAYADFARENSLSLARKFKNIIVSRTFSKSYSLAGLRIGFAVGNAKLIEAMMKVKDSYNLDRLAQKAGEAALSDAPYYRRCIAEIVKRREWLQIELRKRGWFVHSSETNFVFTRPVGASASKWLEALRQNKILVRWFSYPETRDYLRITIGTQKEMNTLLKTIDRIT